MKQSLRILRKALLILLVAGAATPAAAQSTCPIDRIASQTALARAIESGKPFLQVLVAAKTGALPTVADRIAQLGGRVIVRFDSVDYLRAELPTGAYRDLCRTSEIAALVPNGNKSMRGIRDPEPTRRPDPRLALHEEVQERRRKPPPDEGMPILTGDMLAPGNPYLPIHQVGALELRRMEPRADGRGVTIANMEGLFDPAHPTMRGALDLDGRPIGKIAGVIDASATEDLIGSDTSRVSGAPAPDPSLVRRDTIVEVTGSGDIKFRGRRLEAPRPGRFSVGRYHRDEVERPVFWTEAHEVWIDTDADGDLTEERRLTDIGTTTHAAPAYTTLPPPPNTPDSIKPATDPTAFVQFDSAGRPHVYIARSSHSTMVSSTAAGSGFLGGEGGSVTPAARLMQVNGNNDGYTRSLGQYVESFILAAADPRVDVLTASTVISLTPVGSGESVPGVIFERLARVYGKTITIAADNQGVLAHPTVQSASPLVLSVGAYYGGETIEALYGWKVPARHSLATYSSGGPAINGAFKPDLVAPTMSLAADHCGNESADWTLIVLPDCYGIGGGTSNATPFAAGSAAALISAAKLHSLPHDARQITWALRTGARPLAGYSIAEAGAGLIQLDRSWELLQRVPELPDVSVSAPVERLDASYLQTPGRGPGLLLHDGWFVGRSEHRMVTISIPRSGEASRYELRWRDNDGTFELGQPEIVLHSGERVDVAVRVSPKTPGMHAAALEIVNSEANLPVSHIAVAVVAAARPGPGRWSVEQRLTAPWPRAAATFVYVPPGISALRLDLRGRGGKICHANMVSPISGIDASPNVVWHYWNTLVRGQSRTTTMSDAAPGTWQLRVEPCWSSPAYNQVVDSAAYHVELDAVARWTLYGASLGPTESREGENGEITITTGFRNTGAGIERPDLVTAVGRVIERAEGLLDDEPVQFNFTVDSTATNLYVSLDLQDANTERTADPGNEAAQPPWVDVYLYRCAPECLLARLRPGRAWTKTIRFQDPSPGLWKVLMLPVRRDGRTVRYTGKALVTTPQYGTATGALVGEGRLLPGASRAATITVTTPGSGTAEAFEPQAVLVDLIDAALDDPPETWYVRIQSNAFMDWPPVPVATAVLPLGTKSTIE